MDLIGELLNNFKVKWHDFLLESVMNAMIEALKCKFID